MAVTTRIRIAGGGLLLAGLLAGTLADRPAPRRVLVLGGYRVLAADFHTHSSTWSDGLLTPWGLVLEAERQGIDVLAVTGHNEVGDAKVARWFSERIGGPAVIVGEEIHAVGHHVIALGLTHVVDFRLPVARQIAEVHQQGGVAIAAHPTRGSVDYDDAALAALDGSEICHPLIYYDRDGQARLARFAAKGRYAAIGSSDFHGTGRIGLCRTYVFATDDSAASVLEALRAHRTVVYGLGGRAYGDPTLIQLAEIHPELREQATVDAVPSALDWISRIAGVLGLVLIVVASG